MSSYSFIINGIRFSYSSLSAYDTCPYSWKLNYIDKKPKANNFFAEYGRLVHDTLEKFFQGQIEIFEMTQYFQEMYPEVMKSPLPPYPKNIDFSYKESALDFFNNFSYDYDKYEILDVEKTIKFKLSGTDFTGRPDLLLKNKSTDENYIVDFKTSKVFRTDKRTGKEKKDKKKLDGYKRQMSLYTYGLRNYYKIPIHNIMLWFTRPNRKLIIPWDSKVEQNAVFWAEDIIERIKKDEDFPYNNTNSFFCDILCNVRESCEYKG